MNGMFGILHPPSHDDSDHQHQQHAPLTSPPPPNTLTPMPASDFPSRDALLAATKDWAASQGYAVVIQRSRFNRMWLKCDRGGSYENRRQITPEQRKRKRGESRLLGCPFKMVASVRKDGTWHVETENGEHNHDPSSDLTAHPTLRRMTPQQQDKVAELFDNGSTPAETMAQLKLIWPDIKILTRDVYNARKKHKTVSEAQAADLPPPPPVQDPNGIIPGPNSAGRWAWVPEGEEVTNKKGKRRRKTMPASSSVPNTNGAAAAQQQPSNLDPQLHPVIDPSSASPRTIATQLQSAISGFETTTTPNNHNNNQPTPHTPAPAAWMSTAQTDPSPSHSSNNHAHITRSAPHHRATRSSQSNSQDTIQDDGSSESRARGLEKENAILLGRIDRMEKEQNEQKEMLAAILGAVRGGKGAPADGEGA